jgi:hypothetical protein
MPEHLRAIVQNMTPMQRAYAEWRAKGLTQGEAAARAGSQASDRAALGRVGYQLENVPGVKELIVFIQTERGSASAIDDLAIVEMLKDVYAAAMDAEKYKEAVSAVELMGKTIGLFSKTVGKAAITEDNSSTAKAFTEEDVEQDERIVNLQNLLKQVTPTNNNGSS